MSPMLVPATSIIVGLYSVFAAALWLIRPSGIDFGAPGPLLPYFHAALVFLSAAFLLYGTHAQEERPILKRAVSAVFLLAIIALGAISMGGYVLNPYATSLLLKIPVTSDYQTLRSLLAPIIALIGLASLSRTIRAWVLMGGGTILLFAAVFLVVRMPSASPILLGLIGIGFILIGNEQYQEKTFRY